MRPARSVAAAVVAIVQLVGLGGLGGLGGCGDEPAKKPPPSAPPAAAPPPAPLAPPPTAAERVRYWADRLIKGPEPIEEGAFPVGDMGQSLLEDAVQALGAAPTETAALLADPALIDRQTKVPEEAANPWLAFLDVLVRIGKAHPAVARAWAMPALAHPVLLIRRRALPVLVALEDDADGPALLDALRKDARDRIVGPTVVEALVRRGPPWDARVLRVAFERGNADLWARVPDLVFAAPVSAAVRTDLLAGWAALAAGAGPLATEGSDVAGRTVYAPDPGTGPVVAPAHATTSGSASAARARALLAELGSATHRALLRQDVASADPATSLDATLRLARTGDLDALHAAWQRLARAADALERKVEDAPPPDAEIASLVHAVGDLPPGAPPAPPGDDETKRLLSRVLAVARPARSYPETLVAAFAALGARGVDTVALLAASLRSPSAGEAAFGATVLRRARDPAHRVVVRAILATEPPGPRRHEWRSMLLYLETAALEKGGVELDALSLFAAEVARWVEDGGSDEGFAAALMDLGPPGEAAFAAGLSSPKRPAYVAALSSGRRLVPAAIVEALLAPVRADTPAAERRAALAAAFRVAGSDARGALAALRARLRPPERAEVEWIARIVSFRAPRP